MSAPQARKHLQASLLSSSSRNSSDLTELCFPLTSNLRNSPQRWPEAIIILLLQKRE